MSLPSEKELVKPEKLEPMVLELSSGRFSASALERPSLYTRKLQRLKLRLKRKRGREFMLLEKRQTKIQQRKPKTRRFLNAIKNHTFCDDDENSNVDAGSFAPSVQLNNNSDNTCLPKRTSTTRNKFFSSIKNLKFKENGTLSDEVLVDSTLSTNNNINSRLNSSFWSKIPASKQSKKALSVPYARSISTPCSSLQIANRFDASGKRSRDLNTSTALESCKSGFEFKKFLLKDSVQEQTISVVDKIIGGDAKLSTDMTVSHSLVVDRLSDQLVGDLKDRNQQKTSCFNLDKKSFYKEIVSRVLKSSLRKT